MSEGTACLLAGPECSRTGKIKRGLCNVHYKRAWRAGLLEPREHEVFKKFEIDDHGCWIWTGRLNADGYGATNVDGHNLAHRAFYEHFSGPIPDGMTIDHRCRVRACVNPDHLEPVPFIENLRRARRTWGEDGLCSKGLHDITDPANVQVSVGKRNRRRCKPCRHIARAKSKKNSEVNRGESA